MLIAGLIELSTAFPYIRDVRNGKTHPAIVSWSTWFVLAAIAAMASFSEGVYASGAILSALALECFLIIVFSVKKFHFAYTRFDVFCQLGALVGLFLWWWTDHPLFALISFVVIDAVGSLPTFRHAWRMPREETLLTFSLAIVGNLVALIAIPIYAIPEILVPAYLLVLNSMISITIIYRNRVKLAKELLKF
ncbi:MAG: hypothetical protein A2942_02465 [Candidatus Lloydbacteria bacterium RIFCSPLOWO2_01_FULL_50_20]|uniref:Uncharacterized protein n=1 Tax=Candidatus Lloydbacteria bacterium RIFCSPLOWO2_01_FULL_50_20 TaxID=1798665 RepID=A0A1G2DE78_9BACT|nr:MAG: hypothetical protein A2942_02465 [Candidatus Lloydbacteria bacterium RIFCSPLOWO2_01_FULL_50_20]